MASKLVLSCDIDGGHHRFDLKCDYRHVHICTLNGRLCELSKGIPEHCKAVGKKLENCMIERVVT